MTINYHKHMHMQTLSTHRRWFMYRTSRESCDASWLLAVHVARGEWRSLEPCGLSLDFQADVTGPMPWKMWNSWTWNPDHKSQSHGSHVTSTFFINGKLICLVFFFANTILYLFFWELFSRFNRFAKLWLSPG